jgi:electron transport complex protein RnfD
MNTQRIMLIVLMALLPGVVVQSVYYGWPIAANLLTSVVLGLAVETICLCLLRRPLLPTLTDATTPLTCVLLALALPPGLPLPVLAVAVATAVGLAKYLYGGLGNNLFNPAMVGYAVVLVSFPLALAAWSNPLDGATGATALTAFKFRGGATVADVWSPEAGFGDLGGYGWEWINAGFLAGGLVLAGLRLIAWRIPVAMLTTLALLAAACYDGGSSRSLGSPLYQLFTGSTMLGAFFIATDPVTHPATPRGQLLFGVLAGTIVFLIRGFGNYPDGIAFAVLLGNAVTPYLDRRLVATNG